MGGKEGRQRSGDDTLKSERAAHSDEPAWLRLHAGCGLLGSFRFHHGGARVFEDLLANLGQAEAAGRAIEQPYAESLFQQCDPPAEARLRHTKRAGAGREPAMEDNGSEELEIIEVAHHVRRSSMSGGPSYPLRRSVRASISESDGDLPKTICSTARQ